MLSTIIFFLALISSLYTLLNIIVNIKGYSNTKIDMIPPALYGFISSILWSYLFYLLH